MVLSDIRLFLDDGVHDGPDHGHGTTYSQISDNDKEWQ